MSFRRLPTYKQCELVLANGIIVPGRGFQSRRIFVFLRKEDFPQKPLCDHGDPDLRILEVVPRPLVTLAFSDFDSFAWGRHLHAELLRRSPASCASVLFQAAARINVTSLQLGCPARTYFVPLIT